MGNNSEHGINIENMKNDERVRNLNMTEFYIETLPDVFIVYCEYHRIVLLLTEQINRGQLQVISGS